MTDFVVPLAKSEPPSAAKAFLDSEDGLAAIEMALLAPIVMFLLSLATAAGQGFEIQRRVALTANTITGLVAAAPLVPDALVPKATDIAQSAIQTDIALSAEVMYPQPTTTLTVVISELLVNPVNNTGVVVWSEPSANTTSLPIGTVVQLSSSLIGSGATYMIYGQFQYTWQPLSFLPPITAITTNATQILIPRYASQIIDEVGQ